MTHSNGRSSEVNPPASPTVPRARSGARHRRARPRGRRRVVGVLMLGGGVLILAASGWVAWRSYQAYSHLQAASAEVSTLQEQITDVTSTDRVAMAATVERLQGQAGAARSAVDDPIFRSATLLPFVGTNLGAVRQVAVTVDTLAGDVMPSLVQIADTLQPGSLAPTGGAIDLTPIQTIAPLLQTSNVAVDQAITQLAAIDSTTLVRPVGNAVVALRHKLDQASEVTETAARAARLLPAMLGADGPRTYLVVFQNPTELRATGGIFGSFGIIKADRGTISVVDQGVQTRTLGTFEPPIDGLTDVQRAAYTDEMAKYPADVNFTPDFPTAAKLFTRMYQARGGGPVDGVIAIDPVALSYMLRGSAPIDVGDGVSLTADNLVPTLLSTAYAKFDAIDQGPRDAFLAAATSQVFATLMKGTDDPSAILTGLRKAAGERRVLIYSASPIEQADIAPTGLSGVLGTDPSEPSIGVFLNDGTGAKLGYYLNKEVHVTQGNCRPNGQRELLVHVLMLNTAPADGLPVYVSGDGVFVPAYTLRTNVLLLAPVGGGFGSGVLRDGAPTNAAAALDLSRNIAIVTVDLTPGATTDLMFTVLTPPGPGSNTGLVRPELVLTPGVTPWLSSVDSYTACEIRTG